MDELSLQYQINSSVNACHARIENGANIDLAFTWLNEELQEIYKGVLVNDVD